MKNMQYIYMCVIYIYIYIYIYIFIRPSILINNMNKVHVIEIKTTSASYQE